MKLGTLSLATDESFIEHAVLHGMSSIRMKYNRSEIDKSVDLAKALSVLVGFNAKEKISFKELKNPSNRMSSLFFDYPLLSLAAVALAFQNEASGLRGAVQATSDPAKGHLIKSHFKDQSLYTPIVFEYLWRAVARYNRQDGNPVSTASNGPVEAFVLNYLNTGTDKAKCFSALNLEAKMTPYASDADALKAANECWLFNSIWKKNATA